MQWHRGLFRIWIVLSIIWTASLLLEMISEHENTERFFQTRGLHFGWPIDWLMQKLLVVLLPWILTAIVFGIRWIVRGFRA